MLIIAENVCRQPLAHGFRIGLHYNDKTQHLQPTEVANIYIFSIIHVTMFQ